MMTAVAQEMSRGFGAPPLSERETTARPFWGHFISETLEYASMPIIGSLAWPGLKQNGAPFWVREKNFLRSATLPRHP
jgi:hypothetical protein